MTPSEQKAVERIYLPGLSDVLNERGWTLAHAGREMGVPWQTIGNICRRTDRRRTTQETAERLAVLLGVPLERLTSPPAAERRHSRRWQCLMVQQAWEECQVRREKRDRGELPSLGQRRTPQVAKRMLG